MSCVLYSHPVLYKGMTNPSRIQKLIPAYFSISIINGQPGVFVRMNPDNLLNHKDLINFYISIINHPMISINNAIVNVISKNNQYPLTYFYYSFTFLELPPEKLSLFEFFFQNQPKFIKIISSFWLILCTPGYNYSKIKIKIK